jgi:hypothetical protein
MLRELLLSPEKARDIGIKAQKMYQENSGAVEKAMKIIGQYISPKNADIARKII